MWDVSYDVKEHSMGNNNAHRRALLLAGAPTVGTLNPKPWNTGVALPANARELDSSATQALTILYNKKPQAKALADKAVAVLVFPGIVKGGFIIGGQYGDGALRRRGQTVAYYRSIAASYGLQAGGQKVWYLVFF